MARSTPSNDGSSLFETDAAEFLRVKPAPVGDSIQRLARKLPRDVFLGTSSWSYPGWQGLVYGDSYGSSYSELQLARDGLAAYALHPLLRAVGLDRSFYQPLPQATYARYAQQVGDGFRILVKAPALFTDAVTRGEAGAPAADNPHFLDAALAAEHFVLPALRGLGAKTGPLVFQLSPLARSFTRGDEAQRTIERIGAFIAALPKDVDGRAPLYAVELRNPDLLTPRFVRTLREAGARFCLGIHARMPVAARQSAALRAMDADEDAADAWRMKGPLVVRWTLHAGYAYEQAKARYAPFDRLIDVDIPTRGTLAHLIDVAQRSGQPSYVVIGNKAEGSAPLSCIELARAVVDRPELDRA